MTIPRETQHHHQLHGQLHDLLRDLLQDQLQNPLRRQLHQLPQDVDVETPVVGVGEALLGVAEALLGAAEQALLGAAGAGDETVPDTGSLCSVHAVSCVSTITHGASISGANVCWEIFNAL